MNSHAEHDMATNSHGTNWRMWLMLACCLAPLAAIGAVGVFGLPFNTLLTVAIVLLCPLMMVFMMGGHSHGSAMPPSSPSIPDDRSPGR